MRHLALKFKTHIVSEAYQLLAKEESHSKLLELTLVFQAYLNSLVETEDQIRFFEELIDPLSEKTIQLLQAIPNKPIETDQM